MFPLALIDDAVQQIQTASDGIVASTQSTPFENVKMPISFGTPDAVLSNVIKQTKSHIIVSGEYTFKQQTVDDDAILECWGTQPLAQRLVMGTVGNKLRKITLTLNRPGTAAGNLQAHIYSDVGNNVGALVGSSELVAVNTITQGVKQGYTFTFTTQVALQANTVYWVVLTSTAANTSKINWYCRITGADATNPAAYQSGGVWTKVGTKNMVFILIGYHTEGTVEIPIKLVVGPEYQKVYLNTVNVASSSTTASIINADTSEVMYDNLADGQSVLLNPTNTPNIKFKAVLKRDPAIDNDHPKLNSVGFISKCYPGKYQFVDRAFSGTDHSNHLISTGFQRFSGGLQLANASGTGVDTVWKRSYNTGYSNSSGYCVNGAGHKVTQKFYTKVPILVSSFNFMTTGSAGGNVKCSIWLDDGSGKPGVALSDGVTVNASAANTQYVATFVASVEVPPGVFHVGIEYIASYVCLAFYNGGNFEGYGFTYANGVLVNNGCLVMGVTRHIKHGSIESKLSFPGVNEHGLLYPLTYMPQGSTVKFIVTDPVSGDEIITLNNNEKCSLALINTQLLTDITVITELTKNGNSPSVGLCYHYHGSVMSPTPIKRHVIKRYTFINLSAVGNFLTIEGKGKVLYMDITGSSNTGVSGDKHRLRLDGDSVVEYMYYNIISPTRKYLQPDFIFGDVVGPVMFEFRNKLEWDLTLRYSTGATGVIVVALEVD